MQFQADILNKKLIKLSSTECTALGAIYMAGLSLGYYKSISDIKSRIQVSTCYKNSFTNKKRQLLLQGWHNAVEKTIGDN